MKVLGLGTDIVEIDRIEKAMNKTEKFMEKVFSPVEIEYCQKKTNKYESFAGRFCAKEAIAKAMGTGVRNFELTDISIINDSLGKPYGVFYGNLEEYFRDKDIMLTISHCKAYATATAIILEK